MASRTYCYSIVLPLDERTIKTASGDSVVPLESVLSVLSDKELKGSVLFYSYVKHPADMTERAFPHVHIFFVCPSSRTVSDLAAWFGLLDNSIERIRSPYDPVMLCYMVHYKKPDKAEISPSAVVFSSNHPEVQWDDVFARYDSFSASPAERDARVSEIVRLIVDGTIREFNYPLYITPDEYIRYSQQIKKAFDYRRTSLALDHHRDIKVFFITGPAGVGKTRLCVDLCEKYHYSYVISGSDRDPFQNYGGQDAVILDDLRPDSFSLGELLKITDPFYRSAVPARYHDRVLEVIALFITSNLELTTFFNDVFSKTPESCLPLMRRCSTYIRCFDRYCRVSVFDRSTDDYVELGRFDNPYASVNAEKIDLNEASSSFTALTGFELTRPWVRIPDVSSEKQVFIPYQDLCPLDMNYPF